MDCTLFSCQLLLNLLHYSSESAASLHPVTAAALSFLTLSRFVRQEELISCVQLVKMFVAGIWKTGLHSKGSKPKYPGILFFPSSASLVWIN